MQVDVQRPNFAPAAGSPVAISVPAAAGFTAAPEVDTRAMAAKIRNVFMNEFMTKFQSFGVQLKQELKETKEFQTIVKSGPRFIEGDPLVNAKLNKITYFVNFFLKAQDEDLAHIPKKHRDAEVGRFSFQYTVYTLNNGQTKKISYFSEVVLQERYQKFKLFSTIVDAYTVTLKKLETNIDYLNVKSKNATTAAIYKGKGYQFTEEAKQLIDEEFGGLDEYLQDSSVSFSAGKSVKMWRAMDGTSEVAYSVQQFEDALDIQSVRKYLP